MSYFHTFDYVLLAIFLLSTFFAVINGFLKTFLSLFGWIASSVIAAATMPYAVVLLKDFIPNEMIAQFVTVVTIFIIAVIFFALLNSFLLRLFHNFRGGFIDKSLGLFFGLLRGTFIGVLILLSIKLLYPIANPKSALHEQEEVVQAENLPAWMLEAKSYKLIKASSEIFLKLIPDSVLEEYNLDNFKPANKIEQVTILQKLVTALPYGETYNDEVSLLNEDAHFGSQNLSNIDKKDLIIKMLEDYQVALDSHLIKDDERLSERELKRLRKTVKK